MQTNSWAGASASTHPVPTRLGHVALGLGVLGIAWWYIGAFVGTVLGGWAGYTLSSVGWFVIHVSAIVTGTLGVRRAIKRQLERSLAVAGLVLGVVGLPFSGFFFALWLFNTLVAIG